MNSTTPHSAVQPPKQRGCALGCVGTLIGVPLVLALVAYLLIFHTSMPVKGMAGMIGSGDSEFELRGVGGSLSKGVTIEEIVIYGNTENSTIEGFEFRFTGLIDSLRNKHLVIEKLTAESSDIVLGADFFEDSNEDDTTGASEDGKDAESTTSSEGDGGLAKFELRELDFKNLRFRSADGEVDVTIPRIRLAGLKIEGDDFELAELEVLGENLHLELVDATPQQIDGQLVPFTRKIEGSVLPGFHPLVIAEIDFSIELAAMDGDTRSRVIAFGESYQHVALPGGVSLAVFDSLTLGDFLNAEGHLLPERLTLTAREAEKIVEIESGEFFLGKTRFRVAAQTVDTTDAEAAIAGEAKAGDHTFRARMRPDPERLWPPFQMELESEPGLPARELLARIYFQRDYAELAPDEKSKVDELVHTKAVSGNEGR